MSEEPERIDVPPTSGKDEAWTFCPDCGTPVAGKRFCPGCGRQVGSRIPSPAPVVEPAAPPEPAPVVESRPVAEPAPTIQAAPVTEPPRVPERTPVARSAPPVEPPPAAGPAPAPVTRPAPVARSTPPARPAAPAESPFAQYLDHPGVAFAAEFVPGLLGFLGVGWLYARHWPVGIVLLLGWWILLVVALIATVLLGFGEICCFLWLPFHVAVPLISGFVVASEMREAQRRRLMES